MLRRIKNIQDVVDWGLCIGCGACYSACEKQGVRLANVESLGVRPLFEAKACAGCTTCLEICPGYFLDARNVPEGLPVKSEGDHEFGPALEIWEGYAADPEIRFRASSGGILSALALFCLEHKKANYALHTGMNQQKPWLNETTRSKIRRELLTRTGSRYSPSSPCDALADAEKTGEPFLFIGKPCDAAAAHMLRKKRPQLDEALQLSLSFFCAGTPSVKGTLDLIRSLSIPLNEVSSVRYRGNGWPGNFEVVFGSDQKGSISYQDSWSRLTKYRPFRCNLCPDGLGRFSDITCGDAWHRHSQSGEEPGRSLVLVRTAKGKEVLHQAMEEGYVQLWKSDQDSVLAAQDNLLERRRELHGRFLGMQLTGVPVPNFQGFSLWHSWKKKTISRQIRVVAGAVKRVMRRKLWKRHPIDWKSARVLPINDSDKSDTEVHSDTISTGGSV